MVSPARPGSTCIAPCPADLAGMVGPPLTLSRWALGVTDAMSSASSSSVGSTAAAAAARLPLRPFAWVAELAAGAGEGSRRTGGVAGPPGAGSGRFARAPRATVRARAAGSVRSAYASSAVEAWRRAQAPSWRGAEARKSSTVSCASARSSGVARSSSPSLERRSARTPSSVAGLPTCAVIAAPPAWGYVPSAAAARS